MSERASVCFTCGSPVETSMDNLLGSGRPCPTCRERALEALPALLPSHGRLTPAEDVDLEGRAGSSAEDGVPRRAALHLVEGGFPDGNDDPIRA